MGYRWAAALRHFTKDRGGSTIIEFAFILPVFILFLFGAMEMSLVMWGKTSLNYATSLAARYAYAHSKTTSDGEIEAFAMTNVPASHAGFTFAFTANMVPSVSVDVSGTFTYKFLALPLGTMVFSEQVNQPLPAS